MTVLGAALKDANLFPGRVFISMAQLPHMTRSFYVDHLYAVIPTRLEDVTADSHSHRLYRAYCERGVLAQQTTHFLGYCRGHYWDTITGSVKPRSDPDIAYAVGVRFAFELQDNFLGQFATTFFPHASTKRFLSSSAVEVMEYTRYYRATMEYLLDLQWRTATTIGVRQAIGHSSSVAFPVPLPDYTVAGAHV